MDPRGACRLYLFFCRFFFCVSGSTHTCRVWYGFQRRMLLILPPWARCVCVCVRACVRACMSICMSLILPPWARWNISRSWEFESLGVHYLWTGTLHRKYCKYTRALTCDFLCQVEIRHIPIARQRLKCSLCKRKDAPCDAPVCDKRICSPTRMCSLSLCKRKGASCDAPACVKTRIYWLHMQTQGRFLWRAGLCKN